MNTAAKTMRGLPSRSFRRWRRGRIGRWYYPKGWSQWSELSWCFYKCKINLFTKAYTFQI